jgi:hypothetical protein
MNSKVAQEDLELPHVPAYRGVLFALSKREESEALHQCDQIGV